MDQNFILGIMAGVFISFIIFLIYNSISDILNTINNSNIPSDKVSIVLLITLSTILFIGSYIYLMNFTKPQGHVENFAIYSEHTIAIKVTITIVYIVEMFVISLFSRNLQIKQDAVHPAFTKSVLFLVLTGVFLSYDFFILFIDLNPKSYSDIALASISIFITLLIAVLTFKDEKYLQKKNNSKNNKDQESN